MKDIIKLIIVILLCTFGFYLTSFSEIDNIVSGISVEKNRTQIKSFEFFIFGFILIWSSIGYFIGWMTTDLN